MVNPGYKPYIKNRSRLIDHGARALRGTALDIIEYALEKADPYWRLRSMIRLEGNTLWIENDCFDLSRYEHIYLIGAGKATGRIAEAIEELLGDRISGGCIILKNGTQTDLKRVRVIQAAHPIPDENGHKGAQMIMNLAEECGEKDLVISAFTGGSSALLPLPVEGITLTEKQRVNQILLHCGADIKEINAVRKHLSRVKGGLLAKAILPAQIINLTVSDVINDPLDYITDPTVPDSSTFEDARAVLDHYAIWDQMPASASDYLRQGNEHDETPKSFGDAQIFTHLVVDTTVACQAAALKTQELGFSTLILTTMLKGEARECGYLFSAIGREIEQFNRPLTKPCAIIAGGENTVTIQGKYGMGGPNQEFALAAALDLEGYDNILIASIDSDGTDGPTDVAGGMVDGSTLPLARVKNLDIIEALHNHNTYPVLQELGDEIITGHTGTNINDLKMLLVA